MAKDEKNEIPAAMWVEAERLLTERITLPVEEFDSLVSNFAPKEAKSERMERKDRTRAENLADWIKAGLTRRGRIRYYRYGGVMWLVALPEEVGVVRTERLCSRSCANQIILTLLGMIAE